MKYTVVYMGTPHYAKEILEALIQAEDINVALVITQPDKPVGRKQLLTSPPVKVLAEEYDIPVLQPNRLSDEGIFEAIEKVKPDFIIVAAFGQLLPKTVLDIAPCINLHASLLPQYRGASPVQQSLLNGDEFSGVTSMLMDVGLDTGDMLKKIEFKIPQNMRLYALMEQLTKDAATLTLQTIKEFNTIVPVPQNEVEATLCKKIKKSDGEVDFINAQEVYNKYRAFEGWPGVFANNGVKFDQMMPHEMTQMHQPFEILAFEEDAVILGCKQGSLKVGMLQPSGKKMMSAKSYCIGRGLKVGDILF